MKLLKTIKNWLLKPKIMSAIFIAFFLLTSIFVRFFNLEGTTRFTRDESQNLVDMHRIFVDRDLTLLGPIDPTTSIIYPSLTFYMLLPFAILGNFEPVSPAFGTAFFGVLTVTIFALLAKKINPKFFYMTLVTASIWYPLVETSRWAWNPHLVPFMSTLALLLFLTGNLLPLFLSGILFGLGFHLHYLTVISFGAFTALSSFIKLKKKRYLEILAPIFGFILTITPFIIFDLKNPPGLFFTKFLTDNHVVTGAGQGLATLGTIPVNIWNSLLYLGQGTLPALILAAGVLFLAFYDWKNKRSNLIFLLPVLAQVIVISFLPVYQTRYFLLALPFLFVWLIKPRDLVSENVSKLIFGVMIVASLISLPKLLTSPTRPPDASTVRKVSDRIKEDIIKKDLKNVNLAVLESVDPDPLGLIYRHTLLVKETRILGTDEYWRTDNLFVITTASEDSIRKSSGNIMNDFREGPLVETYSTSGKSWKVYLFNRR